MAERYFSVDIEAAAPFPGAYSMLSLGACTVDDVGTTFYAELKPLNDTFVPEALRVAGKSLEEFRKHGKAPQDVMREFAEWIGKAAGGQTPVFVGFNATFDWAFVNWYFHSFLGKNPFGFGGIDIKSYYMGMARCSWDKTRSSHIPGSLKGGRPHTHNALEDAIEQAEMFQKMLRVPTPPQDPG